MRKDWLLFIDIVLIIAIGLTTLYSTVIGDENFFTGGGVVNKQLIFVLIGLSVYFMLLYFNYSFIGHPQVTIPLYAISVTALLLLLIFGVPINGSKRWILIGSSRFQISEFVKIAMIVITAWIISLKHKYNIWILAGIAFASILPIFILIFLEPDASTSMLTFFICAVMIFTALPDQLRNILYLFVALLSGILVNIAFSGLSLSIIIPGVLLAAGVAASIVFVKKYKLLVIAVILVGCILGLGMRYSWDNVLSSEQRERVETFVNPNASEQNEAFQVSQARVAVGSGMLLGKGFGHGTQSKLKFLPEHQTDFIFAAFAEEFGLIGSAFLLVLYVFAIIRIIQAATKATDYFGFLICVGIAVKILIEVLINIGMNVGVMPVTGIPLPLMSRGGSMFLATMICFGLVQSINRNRNLVDSD